MASHRTLASWATCLMFSKVMNKWKKHKAVCNSCRWRFGEKICVGHIFSSSLVGCKSIVWLPPVPERGSMKKKFLYKSTTQSSRTGLPPKEEWRCGIRNLTFKEMNGRFLVRTHELAAEKFVSKLLCLHKSAIFCHAYFVRGEFNPFYKKEKWKVCRARNSLSCSMTITQFQLAWNHCAQYLSDTCVIIYRHIKGMKVKQGWYHV